MKKIFFTISLLIISFGTTVILLLRIDSLILQIRNYYFILNNHPAPLEVLEDCLQTIDKTIVFLILNMVSCICSISVLGITLKKEKVLESIKNDLSLKKEHHRQKREVKRQKKILQLNAKIEKISQKDDK